MSSSSTPISGLFVATPCYRMQLGAPFCAALEDTRRAIESVFGIPVRQATVSGPLVAMNRNVLAQRFLASGMSHLLWVDADERWPPDSAIAALQVAATGQELVGLAYPQRSEPDWSALAEAKTVDAVRAVFTRHYNVTLSDMRDGRWTGEVETIAGHRCVRADFLGGGWMLHSRELLLRMVERWPESRIDAYPGAAFDFFPCGPYEGTGRYMSEDGSFSLRARQLGVQPVVLVDASRVDHYGEMAWPGDFAAWLARYSAR